MNPKTPNATTMNRSMIWNGFFTFKPLRRFIYNRTPANTRFNQMNLTNGCHSELI